MKPLFITFEGGEGAGKSTLIKNIAEWLLSKNYPVVETREPGGTPLATQIRKLLLEKDHYILSPKAELLLFLAARAQHVSELITPSLEEGKIVLCDRFQDSTIAYQGYARGIKEAEELSIYSTGGVVPDLTLYLDLPPEIGLKRAKNVLKAELNDRMEAENLNFHEKVRAGFLKLCEENPGRIKLIDATLPLLKVFQQACDEISILLK